jgi:monomeric isocitrate dehydrogenase
MIIAVSFSVNAQNEKFTKAMAAILQSWTVAKSADDFLSISASFERIGNAEKNHGLAFYYAAYTQVIYGFVKQDAELYDNIAEKAETLLNRPIRLRKTIRK